MYPWRGVAIAPTRKADSVENFFSQAAVLEMIIRMNVHGTSTLSQIELELIGALSRSCDLGALSEMGVATGTKPDDPVVRYTITSCVGHRS
jgi:hypothetical protein